MALTAGQVDGTRCCNPVDGTRRDQAGATARARPPGVGLRRVAGGVRGNRGAARDMHTHGARAARMHARTHHTSVATLRARGDGHGTKVLLKQGCKRETMEDCPIPGGRMSRPPHPRAWPESTIRRWYEWAIPNCSAVPYLVDTERPTGPTGRTARTAPGAQEQTRRTARA